VEDWEKKCHEEETLEDLRRLMANLKPSRLSKELVEINGQILWLMRKPLEREKIEYFKGEQQTC